MDTNVIKATKPYIYQYCELSAQSYETRKKKLLNLINKKLCPDYGWREDEIEIFLREIAMMDSNNYFGSCAVGERESRFASNIVARRHFHMGHGIGRSGDITEIQPKAAGSSLIGTLANSLVLDVVRSIGAKGLKKCIILPMATGMSVLLCLRTFHSMRPQAKYVLWPRIDQKSCFKCILTAGLIPLIVKNEIHYEKQVGSVKEIEKEIIKIRPENIVCILSTTSSFAPKEPDDVVQIGKLCKDSDIPHLVNNAYGIQCPTYLDLIEKASKHRVDLFVSSTDKNFLVPVGGSIISGYEEKLVDEVGRMYPGRGSGTPSMDVFITLLNIGKKGYQQLLVEQQQMFNYLRSELTLVSEEFGEKVLHVPGNCLSLALTLTQFEPSGLPFITEIGSMLFSKFVIGTRLVTQGNTKVIGGYEFKNWGMHTNEPFLSYLTASATVGVSKHDIDTFIKHLREVLLKVTKRLNQVVRLEVQDNSF